MRDRLRSHGYLTFGPINHGFCHSVYIPRAPEKIFVEFSYSEEAIDVKKWIDPTTIEHAGLSAEQVERYCHPPAFEGRGGHVEQPAHDPSTNQSLVPEEVERLSNPEAMAAMEKMAHEPPA